MPLALKSNCSRYTPEVGLCHEEVKHLLPKTKDSTCSTHSLSSLSWTMILLSAERCPAYYKQWAAGGRLQLRRSFFAEWGAEATALPDTRCTTARHDRIGVSGTLSSRWHLVPHHHHHRACRCSGAYTRHT